MNNFKIDYFDYMVIKRIKVLVYIFIVIVIYGYIYNFELLDIKFWI